MDRRLVFFAFMLVWDLVDSDRIKKGGGCLPFLFKEIGNTEKSHRHVTTPR